MVTMWTLVSLTIGSTIGSGIFALPQNIASVASPGAMPIGWVIAGAGMLSIAFVFQVLAPREPHLDSGMYSHVRAGLGDFIGFTSGWGYWLGSVMAQVGYATLFFRTLGYYVPVLHNQWVLANEHFGFTTAQQMRTSFSALERVNLARAEIDDDDQRRKTVNATDKGWIVKYARSHQFPGAMGTE